MQGSWKLGAFRGIDVHIHWTFWLLMIFYTLSATLSGGLAEGLLTATFVALLFACVLAHEFGHALAAARYGIPTRDITLLPIGGLARLERMPEEPKQELVIALAGPMVNVVIAAILWLGIQTFGGNAQLTPDLLLSDSLAGGLLKANIALVLFNMLPAFPMDGGRVLRSLIAMRVSHLRATEIAARIGRWMALGFFVIGFLTLQPMLMLLSVFVFLSGTAELFEARRRAMGSASPWFQWTWTSGPSTYSNYGPYDSAAAAGHDEFFREPQRPRTIYSSDDDIIDAIDVREIKPK